MYSVDSDLVGYCIRVVPAIFPNNHGNKIARYALIKCLNPFISISTKRPFTCTIFQ